jgi:REP element-mobilizing transposase RayT
MKNIHFPKRKTIRLKEYNYSLPGVYFVTICVQGHECILGNILNEAMQLSSQGNIAETCWQQIPEHFPNAALDAFIVMPNHIHGIIIIQELDDKLSRRGEVTSPLPMPTLGKVVAYYKYQSTKQMNAITGNIGAKIWQRNYYEHIIRNSKELDNIRRYILGNPAMWGLDDDDSKLFPAG